MKRWKRRLLAGSLAGLAFAGTVMVLEHWNVSRMRAARAPLGDRLYSEVRGHGPPVLFLAGFEASTRYWDGRLEALSSQHRLIFVDALGFGRSPWPELEYTLDDHLGAIERTLHALDAEENLTIVAHSFGTLLAASYAARHPDRVSRVVLLGTPVFDSEQEATDRIGAFSSLGAVFALNRPLAAASCAVVCAFRPFFFWLAPKVADGVSDAVASDSVLHSWDSFDGTLRNVLLSKPIRTPLSALERGQVTFVHGDRDPITPLHEIESLAADIGANVVVVQSDHQRYLEHPREIVAAVQAPAAGQPRGSALQPGLAADGPVDLGPAP